MANYANSSGGFGLMRAVSRVRTTAKGATLLPEPKAERTVPRATSGKPVDEMRRTAERQDGQELWPLPGLAPMTRVRTSFGDVHAIALRKGDDVLVRSGQYKPIQWIDRIRLDEHILKIKPDSNPVLVKAGAFGRGNPSVDIMVSPRQLFCDVPGSDQGTPQEAASLLSRSGVTRFRETGLTYTLFHVGEPAEVYCEGLYLSFPLES